VKPLHAVMAAVVALSSIAGVGLDAQSGQNDTPYVATKLIWRWRGIMNATLEESRAFASEPVLDMMEFVVDELRLTSSVTFVPG